MVDQSTRLRLPVGRGVAERVQDGPMSRTAPSPTPLETELRLLRSTIASPPPPLQSPADSASYAVRPTQVFVGNLPFDATGESIKELFGKVGNV